MNFVKGTCSLAIVGLLAACGGGSDGGSSALLQEQQLSLQTVKHNYCGVESPIANIKVLFHNQSGDVINEYATDQQGQLQVDWPSNAKHVTVAGDDYYTDGSKNLYLITELDVEAGDLGEIPFLAFNDQAGCNCHKVDIDLQQLINEAPDSSLYIGSSYLQLTSGTTSMSKTWCDNYDGISIQLIAADNSSSMAGDINLSNVNNLSLTLEDFTSPGVEVNVDWGNHITRAYAKEGWSNTNLLHGGYVPVFIYPGLTSNNYVRYHELDEAHVGNATAEFYTYSYTKVDSEGEITNDLQPWELSNNFTDALYKVLTSFASNQLPYQYDFSNADNNIAFTRIALLGAIDTGSAEWIFSGGVSGEIPDFDLTEALEAELASLHSAALRVSLRGYSGYKPLNEWRKLRAAMNEMDNSYLSPLNDESRFMEFTFELDR
ncbi:hypothetical protein AB4238_03035 [Shewanella sp. 10N.286.45.A1]|uniref:hypothetical protein n=1 Tax=Shewanella sp. 10N.286.45.A1 TaxID=3229694 RepID=UPI00354C755A